MRTAALAIGIGAAVLLGALSARADDILRFETREWLFEAPSTLVTQADLELVGQAEQICSDEVQRLIGYRPHNVERFTAKWVVGTSNGTGATNTGTISTLTPDRRLVDDSTRSFRQRQVSNGICFGPHEVMHVMTWESWGLHWPNEGLATFADLIWNGSYRCCAAPRLGLVCDATGYSDGSERRAYSDLSRFAVTYDMYRTAACFWIEIYTRGGFDAIRRMLGRMRMLPPTTTGQLVVQHANVVLGTDLRPLMARYGFGAALDAPPPPQLQEPTLAPLGNLPPPVTALTVTVTGVGTVKSTPGKLDCARTCSGYFDKGSEVALTAVPAASSRFAGWGGACAGTGACTVPMSEARAVTATFVAQVSLTVVATGMGTVTSDPPGIACPPACTASFDADGQIVLAAAPAAGFRFAGWQGACSGSDSCTIALREATSVTARFEELRCLVPRIVGLRLAAARTALARADCAAGRVRKVASAKPAGLVVAQAPPAGASLPRGAAVSLDLSRGRR